MDRAKLPPTSSACFNTQPPEGGWLDYLKQRITASCFNTQPPEGGWEAPYSSWLYNEQFQHTAARRRLAGATIKPNIRTKFQHTAARRRLGRHNSGHCCNGKFQHTAARRRLGQFQVKPFANAGFQHTAARRRLEPLSKALLHQVSQP